jgi:hypothetical protein
MLFPDKLDFDNDSEFVPLTDEEYYRLFGQSRVCSDRPEYPLGNYNRHSIGSSELFKKKVEVTLESIAVNSALHNRIKNTVPEEIIPSESEILTLKGSNRYVNRIRRTIIRDTIISAMFDSVLPPSACYEIQYKGERKNFFMLEYNLTDTSGPTWMCCGTTRASISMALPKMSMAEGVYVKISAIVMRNPEFEIAYYCTESFSNDLVQIERSKNSK